MEGVAVILAMVALVAAVTAVALVVRAERRPSAPSPSGARLSEQERRLAHLVQRLEVLEADVDARHGNGAGRGSIDAIPRGTAAISRIGLVRFDAFEDTGGAQSFALALVDDHGDGVVLTSLHARAATRVYIKSIRRGVADTPLSREEEAALTGAGIAPSPM